MEDEMDCALWLGRKKIFSADEICSNFNIAAIRGYFLGGSLVAWLRTHGGDEYAEKLEALDASSSDLNDRLTAIFTQKTTNDVPVHRADEQLIRTIDTLRNGAMTEKSVESSFGAGSFSFGFVSEHQGSFSTAYSTTGSFSASGSFRWNLFGGSFYYGSFGAQNRYGSFNTGSYSLSSFRSTSWSWEWEWEWYLGSFRKNRAGFGSFSGSSFVVGSFLYNSFGSFSGASSMRDFSFGFGAGYMGSFGYGAGYEYGSYKGVPLSGSCRMMTSDEYDEIMYRTLRICPLDRFGYGIHLI